VASKNATRRLQKYPGKMDLGRLAEPELGAARVERAMAGKKNACGHGRVSGLMTGQTGPGKTGTSMHGLSTASPRKKIGGCQKKKEHQAAAEPQEAMCKDRGWPK